MPPKGCDAARQTGADLACRARTTGVASPTGLTAARQRASRRANHLAQAGLRPALTIGAIAVERVVSALGAPLLSGVEAGSIELDHSYSITIGDGEPVAGGIERHRRRLCLTFEAAHDATILMARGELGPHMEHLPCPKLD